MAVSADQTQQLVRGALRRFEELAGSQLPPAEAVPSVLGLLLDVTRGSGTVAWLRLQSDGQQETFQPIGRAGQVTAFFSEQLKPTAAVHQALSQCWAEDKALIVSPGQDAFESTALADHAQFYIPIHTPGKPVGVLQVVFQQDLDPKLYRQFVAFIQEAARSLGTYLSQRQTRLVERNAGQYAAVLDILRTLSRLTDPSDVIHELANRSRPALEAHRAAVVGLWGSPPEVVFADTIETNKKAVLTRTVRLLAEAAAQREVPMSFTRGQELTGEDEGLSPLLEDLFQLGHAQVVTLIPMRDTQRIVGVLVVEHDKPELASQQTIMQQEIARQVGPFLGQAVRWQQRPLRRASDWLWQVKQHPKTAAIRAALAALLVAAAGVGLFVVPVPLHIRTDARLEPRQLAVLTAPHGATIEKVLVEPAQWVEAGQALIELDDTDLQLELRQVEKVIAQQRVALAASRIKGDRKEIRAAELTIDRYEIEAEALHRKIDRSQIRTPIAGIVLSSRPQSLEGMTVSQGQALLELGDLSQFQLVMDIEEGDLSLIQRQLAANEPIQVHFLSHTWPGLVQVSEVRDFSALSPTSLPQAQQQRHVFQVMVPVELQGLDSQLLLANPSGRAKLSVGDGTVAYRYFRRAWHFARMKLFF